MKGNLMKGKMKGHFRKGKKGTVHELEFIQDPNVFSNFFVFLIVFLLVRSLSEWHGQILSCLQDLPGQLTNENLSVKKLWSPWADFVLLFRHLLLRLLTTDQPHF